jgi:hypothetical protein
MDLLLVEGHAGSAERILRTLEPGPQRVIRMCERPMANGSFWPHHELTSAVLLGFDLPTPDKLSVLKRLWASDCLPPCFVVTRPGSNGDRLLESIGHPITARRTSLRLNIRAAHTLPLERLMALERLVSCQNE